MSLLFRKISFLLFIMMVPFVVVALNFSVGSIKAYDGKLWEGGIGDDSTIIKNSSNFAVIIDSLLI